MDENLTVIVSAPDVDAVVAGALMGRAVRGRAEALVFDSQGLVEFFEPVVQQKLPRAYDLVLCGLEVMHRNWDGRLVRPRLMDALRGFVGPILWLSARRWDSQDLRAVGHVLGGDNLIVSEGAGSVAVMVKDRYFGTGHEYEDSLGRLAADRLSADERQSWGAKLRKVLVALKADYFELAGAVGALMEERLQELIAAHGDRAERTEQENRAFACQNAGQPRIMGEMKLVSLSLSPPKHAFWADISEYAREAAGSGLSLCRLEGRQVMLLSRGREVRIDLRVWARYVTDLLPAARSVGGQPDVVPLVVDGLADDSGLQDEVLTLLKDGAHLLRG